MAKSFRTLRRELSEIVRGEELANRIAEKRYDNTSGGGKTFLVGSDGRGLRQIEGLAAR